MYKRTNSNPSQPMHTLEKSIGNQFLFTGCTVYFWSTLWDTPVCQGTRGDGQKDEGKGLLFLCASEYFYTQSDPAVPRPGKDPNEPSVDRRVYHVLSVCVVVKVPLEYLEKWQHEWLLMVSWLDCFCKNKSPWKELKCNIHVQYSSHMLQRASCVKTKREITHTYNQKYFR